jgi:predicted ATPase
LLKSRATLAENQLIVTTHSPLLVDEIPKAFLYACHRVGGKTVIKSSLDSQEDSLSISERILRGDFDA